MSQAITNLTALGSNSRKKRVFDKTNPQCLLTWSALTLVCAPTLSLAQNARPVIESVLVTAQKREESVYDVPSSITAITAQDMQQMRIEEIDDYALSLPNVTYVKFSDLAPDITIRGVSANVGGILDPISASLDGVSFTAANSSNFLNARLFDLERIEVLRGPQGTNSGVAAMGGAINYITAKPSTDALGGELSLDYGRFDTVLGKGIINIPVNDSVAVRASAYMENSDRSVSNAGPSGGKSDTDHVGGRFAVRFRPVDRLSVDAGVSVEDQSYGLPNRLAFDEFWGGEERRQARIARLSELGGDFFASDFIKDAGNDGGDVFVDVDESTDIELLMLNVNATYELDRHTVTFLYGRLEADLGEVADQDFSEFAVESRETLRESRVNSFEIRVSSNYNGRLNWLAGVNHFEENSNNLVLTLAGDEQFGGAYEFDRLFNADTELTSLGLFGSIDYDITDRLQISGGVRLAKDEISRNVGVSREEGVPAIQGPGEDVDHDLEILPRISLRYDITDSSNVYATFAQGYRPGQPQPLPIELGLVDGDLEPEFVTNYEVGIKGRFFDGRVSVAAAVFHQDYEDIQVADYTFVEDFGYVYFDNNVSEAYIRGIEADIEAFLTDELQVGVNVGVLDSSIDINYYGNQLDDVEMPQARPWSISARARYDRELNSELSVFGQAVLTAQDETYEGVGAAAREVTADLLNEFTTLDLSAGIIADRWRLEAYFENVTNETYWLSNATGGRLRGTRVDFLPRMFGLRYNYKFGSF